MRLARQLKEEGQGGQEGGEGAEVRIEEVVVRQPVLPRGVSEAELARLRGVWDAEAQKGAGGVALRVVW